MIYKWVVVGSGPAGIATIGKLLDSRINPASICWIDSKFEAGDLGAKWYNVPANTKDLYFLKYLYKYQNFDYKKIEKNFEISREIDQERTSKLGNFVNPLKSITQNLLKKVDSSKSWVDSIRPGPGCWELKTKQKSFYAKKIVLTTGSQPKHLQLNKQYIPLQVALNKPMLQNLNLSNECIGVFGSSHSAILILKNLLQKQTKVINFYLHPLTYAVYLQNGIGFDNTGLKGDAAKWAKQNLHFNLPITLKRVYSNSQNLTKYLDQCTKVIYSVGFESRKIKIQGYPQYGYGLATGVIAPGIFGLGIGFPGYDTDAIGEVAPNVGAWKFVERLQKLFSLWQIYGL